MSSKARLLIATCGSSVATMKRIGVFSARKGTPPARSARPAMQTMAAMRSGCATAARTAAAQPVPRATMPADSGASAG